MFSANLSKPAFGQTATATTFSSFGAQQPFGQTAATNLFSGQSQPNIFQNAGTTSFGTGTTAQPGFGQTSTLFGQQTQPSSSGGLFGSGNAFGQQNKPTGFGFGSPPAQPGGLFGQQQPAPQPANASLFQQNTNIFGQSTPAFGASTSSQTGTVYKFNPVTGADTMQKNGVAQSISTKHYCITTMKEYEMKSLEELRFEDYSVNRKDNNFTNPHNQFNINSNVTPMNHSDMNHQTAPQPNMNQPTMNQPTTNQPTMNQPTMNQPTMNQPTMNQPSCSGIQPGRSVLQAQGDDKIETLHTNFNYSNAKRSMEDPGPSGMNQDGPSLIRYHVYPGGSSSTHNIQTHFFRGSSPRPPSVAAAPAPTVIKHFYGSASGVGVSNKYTTYAVGPKPLDASGHSGLKYNCSADNIRINKPKLPQIIEAQPWTNKVDHQGPQQSSGFGATAPFGAPPASTTSLFGQPTENKPFGQTTTGFGQPATGFGQSNAAFGMQNQQGNINLFGKSNTAFGTTATTRSNFGFGATTSASTLPFGQQTKPFGTTTQPLFGATTTTQPSTFGAGGGLFNQQQTSQAPAPSLFGKTTQPNTVFGPTQTTGFSFNQPQTTQSSGGLFQTLKPETGGFTNLFGQTQQPTSTFGQTNTFGLQQPSFNTFGKTTTQTTFNPSFGGMVGLQQQQQQQPPTTSLFGNPATKVGGLFSGSTLGQPNLFSSQQYLNQSTQFNSQPQQGNQQDYYEILVPARKVRICDDCSHPCLRFPSADQQTEPNLALLTHSPFPVSPHLESLEIQPKSEPAKYTTNRTELMSLLQSKPNVESTPSPKLKLLPPRSSKPSPLFEGVSTNKDHGFITSSQKRLVIKPTQKKVCPLFSTDAEILDIIADRNKENGDSPRPSTSSTSLQFIKPSDSARNSDSSNSIFKYTDSPRVSNESAAIELNQETLTRSRSDKEATGDISTDMISSKADLNEPEISTSTLALKIVSSRPSIHSTLDNITIKSPISVSASSSKAFRSSFDKEETNHPCGVTLSRPEYYTVPPLEELPQYLNEDGSCIIEGFTIGRMGYGNVYYPDAIDICNLNLDEIVFFRYREICLYPDETKKPPLNTGLNRRAQVTLDDVYPRDPDTSTVIKDVQLILESNFVDKLKNICSVQGIKFLDYRPETGSWVFDVNHFSIYGFGSHDDTIVKKQKEPVQQTKTQTDADRESEKEVIGLGGQLMEEDAASNILDLSTKVYQQELLYTTRKEKEEAKNIEVLTKAFFTQPCPTYSEGSLMMDDNEDYLQHMIDLHDELSMVTMGEGKLLPQFPKPKISVIQNRAGEIPPSESKVKNIRCAKDLQILKGKSFKPCFLKGFKFIDLNAEIYIGRHATSVLDVKEINNYDTSFDNISDYLIKALEITKKESIYTINDDGTPQFAIKESPTFLSEQNKLFSFIKNEHADNDKVQYFDSIWKLCHALFGPLEDENDNRREYLAEWLQMSVIKTLDQEWKFSCSRTLNQNEVISSIFKLLSMRRIYDSAALAMNYDMPELSQLISQLGSTEEFRNNMRMTIAEWYNSFTKDYMDLELKKIYLLLSGNAVLDDVNICEDIDWKRAFGLLLWYVAPAHATIQECLTLYIMAFETENYAVKPYPPYAVENKLDNGSLDALYHILYLYCSHSYMLDHILNPLTHTNDPTDYRMSWFLLQMFKSIQRGVIMESSEIMVHTNFAHQLENLGKWEWSIFVLLFIKDDQLKKKLITKVLERNISTDINENTKQIEDVLVNEMKLPPEWIHSVKGFKCEYKGMYWDCYLHFTCAGLFYKAHEVFIEHVQPHLFISGKHDELKVAVKPLEKYANNIITWNNEVGLILDFFTLNDKFDEVTQEIDHKKLHKELMLLCNKLYRFRRDTGIQKLCVAELSKKCALLQRLIVDKLKIPDFAHSYSNILHKLIMPPDYLFFECMHYMLKLLDS